MAQICEHCQRHNDKRYIHGPFQGMTMELDYCKHCSQDLCEKCMNTPGLCDEGPDNNHEVMEDEDEESVPAV